MKNSPRFTYNIQLAGYAFHYKDEKGAIDFDTFVEVFENFPWGEQMRQREKWQVVALRRSRCLIANNSAFMGLRHG